MTLYAEWEPIVYNISYTGLDGATLNGENPVTYTPDDTIVLINPTKSHYEFE
jgi:hypothetical protein